MMSKTDISRDFIKIFKCTQFLKITRKIFSGYASIRRSKTDKCRIGFISWGSECQNLGTEQCQYLSENLRLHEGILKKKYIVNF